MLDFAIFAVTFLLALVGAVLYLYPVTPDWEARVRLRRKDLGGRSAGSARRRVMWLRPGAQSLCACVLWSWVGPSFPVPRRSFGGGAQLPWVNL